MACAGSWIGEQSGSSVTFDSPNMMRVMQDFGESSGSPAWVGQGVQEEVSSGERTVVEQEVPRKLQFGDTPGADQMTLLDWQLDQAVRQQQQGQQVAAYQHFHLDTQMRAMQVQHGCCRVCQLALQGMLVQCRNCHSEVHAICAIPIEDDFMVCGICHHDDRKVRTFEYGQMAKAQSANR